MATNDEIKAISSFLDRIETIYLSADELNTWISYTQSRYASILAGTDNSISTSSWNSIVGESNDYIVSGNVIGLAELYMTVSGWKDGYVFEELV
jgi:hypothetical protein